MIIRSGIDTQTGSTKTMDYHDKLCRKERYRQRNRSVAETTLRAILVSVFFTAIIATSGCSTQSPASSANRHTEDLAGPGEFILTPEGPNSNH
jgi:hypothetical protein